MKFCYGCSRITLGEPVYCNQCGKSYDTKFCPRLHPNPRAASVCSQCGSSDLSTPQPALPFWMKPFVFVLTIFPGILLLIFTVAFFIFFTYEMFTNPQMQFRLMLLGLIV